MDIREILAKNLQRERRSKGLSQEALAYEAGLDRTYVSALERQKYAATVDVLAKIASVLGVSPASLIASSRSAAVDLGKRKTRTAPRSRR